MRAACALALLLLSGCALDWNAPLPGSDAGDMNVDGGGIRGGAGAGAAGSSGDSARAGGGAGGGAGVVWRSRAVATRPTLAPMPRRNARVTIVPRATPSRACTALRARR